MLARSTQVHDKNGVFYPVAFLEGADQSWLDVLAARSGPIASLERGKVHGPAGELRRDDGVSAPVLRNGAAGLPFTVASSKTMPQQDHAVDGMDGTR